MKKENIGFSIIVISVVLLIIYGLYKGFENVKEILNSNELSEKDVINFFRLIITKIGQKKYNLKKRKFFRFIFEIPEILKEKFF